MESLYPISGGPELNKKCSTWTARGRFHGSGGPRGKLSFSESRPASVMLYK